MQQEKARFDGQLPIEQKQLFEQAKILGGYRSLTEFVFLSAQEKAEDLIKQHEKFLISEKDKEIFFNALTNPPKPNESLHKAASKYKKKIKQ
jgi:uncharacterized protein (DUF1778 family)